MREITTVLSGLSYLECPRWHEGRIWVSDFYTHQVLSVREDGSDLKVEAEVPGQPSGLGWLPDDRLLVISQHDNRLLRREPDGSLVTHADVSAPRPHVSGSARPRGEARPGHAAGNVHRRQPGPLRQRTLERALLAAVLDDARGALILGPVGVGKTHLATALGHIAVRRRHTVRFVRAEQMFRTLKAARLDNSVEAEMRALARIDVLILDDFALQSMDPTQTSDFYELIVERHRKTSTIVTSNRDPSEWIAVMSDPLLAQSAVDRLVSTSYELVIEGESYRRRQRPQPAPRAAS